MLSFLKRKRKKGLMEEYFEEVEYI